MDDVFLSMSETPTSLPQKEQLDTRTIEQTLDQLGLGVLKPALNLFGIGALLQSFGNSMAANPIFSWLEKMLPGQNRTLQNGVPENTLLGSAPTKSTSVAPSSEYIFSHVLSRSKKGKTFGILTAQETYALTNKVFGNGPGAFLLQKLDQKFGGKGELCKRMIALGIHEGGLVFGRENRDPASGYNFGTYQIGGWGSTREVSLKKYNTCLNTGIGVYKKETGITLNPADLNAADKDVLTHIGYIESQRGGEPIFRALANPALSDNEVIQLMHRKIQGGIPAIGKDVVAMTRKGTLHVLFA